MQNDIGSGATRCPLQDQLMNALGNMCGRKPGAPGLKLQLARYDGVQGNTQPRHLWPQGLAERDHSGLGCAVDNGFSNGSKTGGRGDLHDDGVV